MTDVETRLPETWQRWVDIMVAPSATTAERRDQAIAYQTANFRQLVTEFLSAEADVTATLNGVWPHGLKKTAKELLTAVVSEVTRRRDVQKAGKIAELEKTLQISNCLWDSLQDGLPPADIAASEILQSLRVPAGYLVTPDGVFRRSISEEDLEVVQVLVAPAPVFPVARSVDVTTGLVERILVWRTAAGWQRRSVGREVMLDSGRLMELAAYDAPVASGRVRDVVDFLDAFEAVNSRTLPEISVTHRCGWQADGSFVMPETCWPAVEGGAEIAFHASAGFETFAAAWTSKGSLDGWMQMAEAVTGRPMMWVPLYAALSSPLLKPLNVPGWVTDVSGGTSRGKTTALLFAASACGKPTIEAPTIVSSWDNTPVYIEQLCGTVQNLPVFLDETKRAGKGVVRQVIYNFAQGIGRGRGKRTGGAQTTVTWQTNLISTGEQTATSFSQDAGTRARVIQLVGSPMGGFSTEAAEAAELIRSLSSEHYGHVLPLIVDQVTAICRDPAALSRLRKLYQQRLTAFSAAAGSGVARRLAAYVAVMSVTADMLHGSDLFAGLGVPRPTGTVTPFDILRRSMIDSAIEADLPMDCLTEILSRAIASRKHFWSCTDSTRQSVGGEWFGIYDNEAPDGFPRIGLTAATLRSWINEWDYGSSGNSFNEMKQRWKERRLLTCRDNGYTSAVWMDGGTTQVYLFTRKAWWMAGQRLLTPTLLLREVGLDDPDVPVDENGQIRGWAVGDKP